MAVLRDRLGQFQFSTIISLSNDDIFDIENHKILKRFNSSRNPFSAHPIVIIADPFLFSHHGILYLFYEEQRGLRGKGVIKMSKTKDLKKWEKPVTVLEENFHLSFPNVFRIHGQIYMIPETGANKTVSLYKPMQNFTRWEHYRTLLTGKNFVDSSIIFHNESYYLFTTDYSNKSNILNLYYSDSLHQDWIEHPSSPIAQNKNSGRNAGPVFKRENTLYRPCQLTEKRYGEGTTIYKIETLSRTEYKEMEIKKIIPNNSKTYNTGGHHYNYCSYNNQLITATDILEIKLNFFEIAKRVVLKLKSKLD